MTHDGVPGAASQRGHQARQVGNEVLAAQRGAQGAAPTGHGDGQEGVTLQVKQTAGGGAGVPHKLPCAPERGGVRVGGLRRRLLLVEVDGL